MYTIVARFFNKNMKCTDEQWLTERKDFLPVTENKAKVFEDKMSAYTTYELSKEVFIQRLKDDMIFTDDSLEISLLRDGVIVDVLYNERAWAVA